MEKSRDDWSHKKSIKMTLPYPCIYIDAEIKHFGAALRECMVCQRNKRGKLISDINALFTNDKNPNHVLPCLSVRTAFDLFLRIKGYPKGSEVIMSAVNIPDMVYIVHHHGLKVVPLDISIETTYPKVDHLPSLINQNTVAIVVAHIYGKLNYIDDIIDIAHTNGLPVIEDCAEIFCGLGYLGNPRSDLALFSFGVIKTSTAFGGAVAKVKDKELYDQMCQLYETYAIQGRLEYAKKVIKYFCLYMILDYPGMVAFFMGLANAFDVDYKKLFVRLLRGFPNQLMEKIRHRPSTALLYVLRQRLSNFSWEQYNIGNIKAEYVRDRLPREITVVGTHSDINHYWLFPIIVENPDHFVILLNALGVDAYRGATQLSLVDTQPPQKPPDLGISHRGNLDPQTPTFHDREGQEADLDLIHRDKCDIVRHEKLASIDTCLLHKQQKENNPASCSSMCSSLASFRPNFSAKLPSGKFSHSDEYKAPISCQSNNRNTPEKLVYQNDHSKTHSKFPHSSLAIGQSSGSEVKIDQSMHGQESPSCPCPMGSNKTFTDIRPQNDNFKNNCDTEKVQAMNFDPSDPQEARYIIDHVVYLPINKSVPFQVLDQITDAVDLAVQLSKKEMNLRLPSKL